MFGQFVIVIQKDTLIQDKFTVPGLEHGEDEEIVESDLRLGNGAGGPVELRHDHRQAQLLLLVSLRHRNSLEELKYNYTALRSLELRGKTVMLFFENRFLKNHLTAECATRKFRGNYSNEFDFRCTLCGKKYVFKFLKIYLTRLIMKQMRGVCSI